MPNSAKPRYVFVLSPPGKKKVLLERVKTGWKIHTPKGLKMKNRKRN